MGITQRDSLGLATAQGHDAGMWHRLKHKTSRVSDQSLDLIAELHQLQGNGPTTQGRQVWLIAQHDQLGEGPATAIEIDAGGVRRQGEHGTDQV